MSDAHVKCGERIILGIRKNSLGEPEAGVIKIAPYPNLGFPFTVHMLSLVLVLKIFEKFRGKDKICIV